MTPEYPRFDVNVARQVLDSIGLRECAVATGPRCGRLRVSFTEEGRIVAASVTETPHAAEACVRAKLETARIPPFCGPAYTVLWTFFLED